MRPQPSSLLLAAVAAAALAAAALTCWSIGEAPSIAPNVATADPNVGASDTAASVGANEREQFATEPFGVWSAPTGSEFRFEFAASARSTLTLELAEQPATQGMTLRLRGELVVLVADRRSDELIAQTRFESLSVGQATGGSEEANAPLAELLALPTLVRMRDDGTVLGFTFDRGSNPFVNNLTRTIVCGFRFVVPAGRQRTWTLDETDPTGIASTLYAETDPSPDGRIHLTRKKTSYRACPTATADLEVAYEVESLATATIDPALGWLREASIEEAIHARADVAGMRATTGYRATLALLAHCVRSLTELPEVDWDGAVADLAGGSDTEAIGAASADELAMLDVGDATFLALWREIQELTALEPLDSAALGHAMRKLAHLVRLHPEVLQELAAALPAASPFAADALLSAVGAANCAPAQKLLASVALDAAKAPHLRQSSLDAMIQLSAPTDEVLAAVRGVVDDGSASDRLRGNGLLVLGAMGSRTPGSATTDRARVVADLLAREDRARADGRLAYWLHALGNCGDPAVLPALERYVVHPESALRQAALQAVRQIPADRAMDLLAQRARAEGEPSLRAVAVEGLARVARGEHLEFVSDLLRQRTAPDQRRAAVTGLRWQVGRNDAVVPLLQRTAQGDPDATIRDLAHRALAAR